jgi:hypothetical protein
VRLAVVTGTTIGASGARQTASMRVAIRIEREGAVIVGVIVRPQSRRTVIAAARSKGGGEKRAHRGAAVRKEAQMRARRRLHLCGDGRLHAERTWSRTIVRPAPAEIDDPYQAERPQRRIAKRRRRSRSLTPSQA